MKQFKKQYIVGCREQGIEPHPTIVNLPDDDDCTQTLNLGELTLGTKNGIAIGQALHGNQTFTYINLAESYMGDSGVDSVCQGLIQSRVIESIDLRGSNLYRSSGLAQLISKTFSLRELKCFKTNKSIQTLDLRNNKITPEGANALANAIRVNNSLQSVDLRWNYIGVRGGKYILEALHENYMITDLKLTGNEVDFKTLQEIDKITRRNYDMQITKQKETEMSSRLKSEISEMSNIQNRRIETLQTQVITQQNTYSSQIRGAHEQISELEKQNIRLISDLKETKENEQRYYSKMKEFEEKILLLEQNLAHETKSHIETKKNLRESTDELQKCKELIDDLQKEKSRNEATIKKLNEQLTVKEELLVGTNQKLYSAQNDKSELNAQLIDTHRQIEILQSSLRSLTLIEQEYSKIRQKISEMEVEKERALIDLKSKCDEDKIHSEKLFNEKLQYEKEKFNQLGEEHERLKNKCKQLESNLTKVNEKIQLIDRQLTDTTNESEQKSLLINQLQLKLKDADEQTVKSAEKLNQLSLNHKKELDTYQFKLDSKETQVTQLEKEVRQLQLEAVRLKEQQDKNLYTIESRITQELKSIINELKR
ncbi:hypothetical protein C9374_003380 [Naegleria lovaniensis]|uniref:Leucine Rich Repeat family protein n=1 Tax=Naegleria lovaniensis TaxID=51637 RepID=A0AA88GMT6_NAELO|nr:uncharacterized protein C9374_003380 [Naegleria lovaniensis]KAG2385565.1 hypothetical protein C9374_003380 [Naegleria lovaniensis]